MKTKLRPIGNSAGAIFPVALLKKIGLTVGDEITFEEEGGKIIISDAKPRYSLDELLAKCDENAPVPTELMQWNNLDPVGNEAW